MKKQPQRLHLKKETLAPLNGGNRDLIGVTVNHNKDSLRDCTSPLCGPTTCPASCDCETVATVAQEAPIGRP